MLTLSEILKYYKTNNYYQYLVGCLYAFPVFVKHRDGYTVRGIGTNIYLTISYKARRNQRINRTFSNLTGEQLQESVYENLENLLYDKISTYIPKTSVRKNSTVKNLSRTIYNGVSVELTDDIGLSVKTPYEFLSYIEKIILDLDDVGIGNVILGIFDSRGSLDFSFNYMSLDLVGAVYNDGDENESALVNRKRRFIYQIADGVLNYNPRLLQPQSNRKNDQLRINLNDFTYYYGIFTPFKIFYYLLEKYGETDYKVITNYGFVYKNTSTKPKEKLSRILDTDLINDDVSTFEMMLDRKNIGGDERKRLIELFRIEKFETDVDEKGASSQIKYLAKELSKYKCELDSLHTSFIARSNRKPYVEAHHLIPYSKRNIFDVNIDTIENLVTLCPVCHKKIHAGLKEEVKSMIDILLSIKKDSLKSSGIEISKEEIYSYYL